MKSSAPPSGRHSGLSSSAWLLEIGHSQRRAVLLIYLWAGVLAFGAVALTLFDPVIVVTFLVIGLIVAVFVSAVPRLREARKS